MIIKRSRILQGIREFFLSRGFIEVETPVVLPTPSQEPYLEPLRTTVRDNRGKSYDGFLRMSPEFSLKKLIARMCGHCEEQSDEAIPVKVFEIGPVFRDSESWGETHNPEFTILEWYEVGADYRKLMVTCEELITSLCHSEAMPTCPSEAPEERRRRNLMRSVLVADEISRVARNDTKWDVLRYQDQHIDLSLSWERLTMRQAWKRYAKLELDKLLTRSAMAKACRTKGYTVNRDDTFDDLFFKIHLSEVEPKLGRTRPTFLTDWPASMAALARKKPRDPKYAERVELYIGGLEIANGFSELVDADEQLARFRADQRLRKRLGKTVYPIDHDFITALRSMPPTAGIALGVDRLVMLLLDAATIDEVRWLPADQLWE